MISLTGVLVAFAMLFAARAALAVSGLPDDQRDALAGKYDLGYVLIEFDGSRFTYEVMSEAFIVDWKRASLRRSNSDLEITLPDVFLLDGTAIYSNAIAIPRREGYSACPWSIQGVVQCVEYLGGQAGADQVVVGLRTRQ